MKITKKILFSFSLFLSGLLYAQDFPSPRTTINLNREWKYVRGDYQGAEQQVFNDEEWEQVGLPHSFSIPYFMSKDFYIGYGWYRKSVSYTHLYYKFSKKILAATPLHSVKLYVRASDFTLFDHVDVCDPEAMGNTLPIPSSVQLGFSIGF